MALNIRFDLPLKGYSVGIIPADTPRSLSGDMNNVRPQDSIERRLRIGQRPGLSKASATQIATALSPVVAIGSVSVVDYTGE